MRLRPYFGKSDYKFVEEWVNDKRVHVLWSAGRLPCPLTREALEEFLERDAAEWGGCAYTATQEDGTPVGFFCYSINLQDNAGFLKFILLDPELRGKGYGVQMIRLALKYAFEITGAEIVRLNVFHVNEAALGCYRKAGFAAESVTEAAFAYGEEKWDRICMAVSKDVKCGTGVLQNSV